MIGRSLWESARTELSKITDEKIKNDMIKDDCVLIDVGINRINDDSEKGYHIEGDIDFEDVQNKASAVTPVPGGVGVMTVTMLLYNTINSINNY